MEKTYAEILKKRLTKEHFDKLQALQNSKIIDFVGEYIELCNPESVFVRTDLSQDTDYIRKRAVDLAEESRLSCNGHTVHFDGFFDQARDKKKTKYLLSSGRNLGPYINSTDRDEGLREIKGFLKDIMKGKQMFVCFFCLGPVNSDFSILAVQITDSAYVSHSEDILYRPGYDQFKANNPGNDFFRFVHSAGVLENNVSSQIDKRRVSIDLSENIVYSVNTQYAGNTVGLKKLALRLAIQKASKEGWLAEHMFVMGVSGKDNTKTYFCGAYPSMCGKTSTAMLAGESIIGDDIAYLRIRSGKAYAANVERGIFGIIKDVNSKDDPVLFKALSSEGEVIVSNVLIDEKKVAYWIGKDAQLPHKGSNFSGDWVPGKTDQEGGEISASHKNARYTVRLSALENVDSNLEEPAGVEVKGLIYGGRDSDTYCPVEQSLSWRHGIIMKAASLESETTAATLGKEGIRVFNPMSNIDFLSIGLGRYIEMNLEFGEKLSVCPIIFSANYFLKDKGGKFLNAIEDKRVWLKWMKLRVEEKACALVTAGGLIPLYEDLRILFESVLGKQYIKEAYVEQFTLRIPERLAKIERIGNIYNGLEGIPEVLFNELALEEKRLNQYRKDYGDYVSPLLLTEQS